MSDSTITLEKFNEIISDLKNQSNGELERVMDFLNDDFQETKEKSQIAENSFYE